MDNVQNSDFEWFLNHFDSLFNEYGDSFLVIKNKTVIKKCDSYAQGVREAAKTEELGTFIVQHCSKDKIQATNTFISSITF